jgi:hypothetical protein
MATRPPSQNKETSELFDLAAMQVAGKQTGKHLEVKMSDIVQKPKPAYTGAPYIPIRTDLEDPSLTEQEMAEITMNLTLSKHNKDGFITTTVADSIARFTSQDPIVALNEVIPEDIDFRSCQMKAKFCQMKAFEFQNSGDIEMAKSLFGKAMQYWLKAFASDRMYLILFAAIFNGVIVQYGIDKMFPDQTIQLLELAIKNYNDPRIFLGYWKYVIKNSTEEEVIRFVIKYAEYFSNDAWTSDPVIQSILKHSEHGDEIDLKMKESIYRKTIIEGQKLTSDGSSGIAFSGDQLAVRNSLLLAEYYIFSDSDYAKAHEVLMRTQKRIPQLASQIRVVMTHLADAFVPELYFPVDLMRVDKNGDLNPKGEISLPDYCTKTGIDSTNVVVREFINPEVSYQFYHSTVPAFIQFWVRSELPEKLAVLEKLLAMDNDKQIRIPKQYRNMLVHYLGVEYEATEQYNQLINLCESEIAAGRKIIRASLYTYLRVSLEEAVRKGDTTKYIAVVNYAITRHREFEGTEKEEELWLKYIFPYYFFIDENSFEAIIKKLPDKLAQSLVTELNKTNEAYSVFCIAHILFSNKTKIRGIDEYKLYLKLCRYCTGSEEVPAAIKQRGLKFIYQYLSDLAKANASQKIIEFLQATRIYRNNADVAIRVVEYFLNRPHITEDEYYFAKEMLSYHTALVARFEPLLAKARKKLGLTETEEVDCKEFLDSSIPTGITRLGLNRISTIRLVYLFQAINGLRSSYKEIWDETKSSDGFEMTKEIDVDSGILFQHFGVQKIWVKPAKNELEIKMQVTNPVDPTKMRLITFNTVNGEIVLRNGVIGDATTKLMYTTIEAELYELIANAFQELEFACEVKNEIDSESEEYRGFSVRLQANNVLNGRNCENGMESLTERNGMIGDAIAEKLKRLENDPNFPLPEEVDAIILNCIDIIGKCRDLDVPIGTYKSRVDKNSPLYQFAKFLTIYSPKYAAQRLRDLGVGAEDLARLGIEDQDKNNFIGYYELSCDIPGVGIVEVSIFLDKEGKAIIPSIDKNSREYKYIWMLVMETLMAKVVPEMGAYSHAVNSGIRGGHVDLLKSRNYRAYDEDSNLRRLVCSRLIFRTKKAESDPAQKVEILETISKVLNAIDLVGKDISAYPLFVLVDGEYVSLEGLFKTVDGKQLINIAIAKEVLGVDVDQSGEKSSVSAEYIEMESLPEEVLTLLLTKIKIQVLSGRAWRIPVIFEVLDGSEDANGVIEDEEYEYKPAKRASKNTVEKDGKLYIRSKKKSGSTFEIGGLRIKEKPYVMSERSRKIYEEQSLINIDFTPKEVVYLIMVDPKTNAIKWVYVGPATKNSEGNYTNINSVRYHNALVNGRISNVLSERFKQEMGIKDIDAELDHRLIETESQVGYKQGVFINLGSYFARTRNKIDIGIAILVDMLKKYVDSATAERIAASIQEETTIAQPIQEEVRDRTDAITRKPEMVSSLREAEVREKQAVAVAENLRPPAYIVENKNHGFYGSDLYVIEQGTPEYEQAERKLEPSALYTLVRVGNPKGRPAKVLTSDLILKKT